jgi:tRNA U34 5-carboxymethylaminomethyl modifying GTPase MnmE/TrmE
MKELEKTEGRKQRDHTKTGKLAKKRENRRLDAIERAVRRVQTFEHQLAKAKDKGPAQASLKHAQYSLQTIRGGTDQHKLVQQFGIKATVAAK